MGSKNGKLVTAYLDDCVELTALKGTDTEAYIERLLGTTHDELWLACLKDGWTVAELDAAYARRFGRVVNRKGAANG